MMENRFKNYEYFNLIDFANGRNFEGDIILNKQPDYDIQYSNYNMNQVFSSIFEIEGDIGIDKINDSVRHNNHFIFDEINYITESMYVFITIKILYTFLNQSINEYIFSNDQYHKLLNDLYIKKYLNISYSSLIDAYINILYSKPELVFNTDKFNELNIEWVKLYGVDIRSFINFNNLVKDLESRLRCINCFNDNIEERRTEK